MKSQLDSFDISSVPLASGVSVEEGSLELKRRVGEELREHHGISEKRFSAAAERLWALCDMKGVSRVVNGLKSWSVLDVDPIYDGEREKFVLDFELPENVKLLIRATLYLEALVEKVDVLMERYSEELRGLEARLLEAKRGFAGYWEMPVRRQDSCKDAIDRLEETIARCTRKISGKKRAMRDVKEKIEESMVRGCPEMEEFLRRLRDLACCLKGRHFTVADLGELDGVLRELNGFGALHVEVRRELAVVMKPEIVEDGDEGQVQEVVAPNRRRMLAALGGAGVLAGAGAWFALARDGGDDESLVHKARVASEAEREAQILEHWRMELNQPNIEALREVLSQRNQVGVKEVVAHTNKTIEVGHIFPSSPPMDKRGRSLVFGSKYFVVNRVVEYTEKVLHDKGGLTARMNGRGPMIKMRRVVRLVTIEATYPDAPSLAERFTLEVPIIEREPSALRLR
jgi:hypothetical protein